MKIVKGQYNPDVPKIYSPALADLIKQMLVVEPDSRPTVDDIMAKAIVMGSIIDLYCNIGAVEVK